MKVAMSATPQIQPRTRLFARVLGPYLVIVALTMIGRSTFIVAMIEAFSADVSWPWVAGAFVLLMGLVVIALHPYWRGPAATIVSLLGCLTALKGIALMAFPQRYLSAGHTAVSAAPWWQAGCAVVVVVGLYLTYVGWVANRSAAHSHQSADAAVQY